VRFDLTPEKERILRGMLDHIDAELTRFVHMFQGGPMIALRSKDVGIFTREEAIEAHAVGPTARASNLDNDCRLFHPTYKKLGFESILLDEGDNYARIMLRFLEMFQSTKLIRGCLEQMEPGTIRNGGIIGGGTSHWSGEAPRGELSYDITTDERGRIKKIGIRTPSIMNIEACVHYMLKGVDSAADVTSTYISSDPCIACNER
jgi:energy-converting hydrogenase A subunit O